MKRHPWAPAPIRYGLAPCVMILLATAAAGADAVEESWIRHGFNDNQRDSIRDAFRSGIDQRFIPGGALLILHRGEPILREGFGVADLDTQKPFTADAPCRIASLTKPHTSTLLAMLVERGKLSWDDPIDRYLPSFDGVKVRDKGPAARTPKVRELLSHTAGFPGQDAVHSGSWKFRADGTLADAVEDLPGQGLAAEPGSRYIYSGVGYMVAGRVAEVATGKGFADLMDELLLAPIGATTATFFPSSEVAARVPTPYERRQEGFVKLDRSSRPEAAARFPNPGGSLVSTLDDVGRLFLLHRNRGVAEGKKLIAPGSLSELYRPQPPTGQDGQNGYGLGFNILKTADDGVGVRIRHTGASGTFAQLDFENDVIVVILTQVPQAQTQPFRDRLLKAISAVFLP
jgi:CubicO group peptidase (beta-lactamase class C family)